MKTNNCRMDTGCKSLWHQHVDVNWRGCNCLVVCRQELKTLVNTVHDCECGRRPFPSPYLTGPLSRRNHGSSASIVEIDASGMSLPTGVPEHGGAFPETSTLRSPCNSATYKPGMLADTISRILPSQRSSNSLLPARHTDISFSSQAPSSAQPVESLHQLWKEEITTAIFPGLGSL